MKSILTAIFSLFIITQLTVAQFRVISGNIVDFNNKPLKNAMVRDSLSSVSTQTDEQGYYSIKVDSTCEYLLVSHKFHETKKIKLTSSSVLDVNMSFNPELQMLVNLSLDDLLSIKVTAPTNTLQSIKSAPATISVITARQIEERGYQSVGEALNSVAGIYPLYDYLQYNMGVRGVNGGMRAWSRIIKVMINGQPVSFRPSSETFLGEELIPLASVDRIEVIRGPASALYGANAFLGVVNIVSKKTNKEISGEVSGKFEKGENINGKGVNAFINGKSNNINYLISSSVSYTNRSGLSPVDVPGNSKYLNQTSKNDISKPKSFYSKIDYTNEKIGNFSLDLSYQNVNSYGEFQDWGALTHNNQIDQINYYSRIKYEKEIFSNFKTNVSIAFANSMIGPNDKLDVDTSSSNWITRKVGTKALDIVVNSDYTIKKESNIKVGFDFTNENNDLLTYYLNQTAKAPVPQQGKEFGDTAFRNTGIFLQAILDPSELLDIISLKGLGITSGIRYDMHNIYGNVFNYRIAGVYSFNKSLYTKLLYGTSYKAPSPVQLYSNYIAVGDVIGNPNLKPEKAQTVEWAIGMQPLKALSINTTFFYNTVNDKVELILPYGTTSNASYDNIAKISSVGTEVEVLHNYKSLMNYVNFSYQRSILSKENLTKDRIKIQTELYPTIMVKFGSNLAIPKYKLNLNLEGRYISSLIASQLNNYIFDPVNFRTNRYELAAYYIFDLTVSTINLKFIKESETRFMFKIYNVFDENGAWPGYRDFDIPFMGRNFAFMLIQKF